MAEKVKDCLLISRPSRREFLGSAGAAGIALTATDSGWASIGASPLESEPTSNPVSNSIAAETAVFIEDLQRRCYRFFLESTHPLTGLVADRARTDGTWRSPYASSATCGFSLVADAIAATSSWGQRELAEQRTEKILDTMLHRVEHERGFFYHFIDATTYRRAFPSEISSIDTAIFVAGAMVASSVFSDNSSIVSLSDQIIDRIDWQWMLNGSDQFSMGWTPEGGFLPTRWDRFSELTLMVLIAIGARDHAVPPACWRAWRRDDVLNHNGQSYLSYPPLFVHQYPQAFFDFRKYVSPSGRSYWNNSVTAHQAQVTYLSKLAQLDPYTFGHYGSELWGLTSSDSSAGYRDWGGPYRVNSVYPERGMDGTIVPSAAAGGLPILPDETLKTLLYQRNQFGDQIYGRYGFVNAYNPRTGWIGSDVIGIDTGISLIMAENFRSGKVWDLFMEHDIARRGFELAGFQPA